MRVPFLVVAIAWFATMAGANLATPLYAVYEREFGFSSAVLTVVFATQNARRSLPLSAHRRSAPRCSLPWPGPAAGAPAP
jgi:hypothetical protein